MPNQPPAQPPFSINAQYVKDLSFENPNPLKNLSLKGAQQPDLNVNVDVSAQKVTNEAYEVTLRISAEAVREAHKIFIVDLHYGGVFTLNNVPEDQVAPLLLIEGPRFLFPFARNVIADATREGGFPPLALAPIDFLTLYQTQQAKGSKPPSFNKKTEKTTKSPSQSSVKPKSKAKPKAKSKPKPKEKSKTKKK